MEVKNKKFIEFKEEVKGEGIVILGAGGEPDEWITGVMELLQDEKIIKTKTPEETYESITLLITTGGRRDLAMEFKEGVVNYNMMAIWRLKFQNCSWISDYKVNYAKQHYEVIK